MAHEFDGKKYEKASAHQKEWGARLVAELSLQGDERVLDLGCGDGANTALVAERLPGGVVIGIDASKGMLEAAKPRQKANLRFALMDIDTLSFVDEFDAVISNATLHWIKDHRRLLQNVHRALRPGGIVRFNFAADGNCIHFFKVVRQAVLREEFVPYFSEFIWPWYMPTVGDYTLLAEESPLTRVKVRGENADRFFPDADALIRWLDQPSLVPFLACIAEKDRAAFRNHVVDEMLRETRQPDGRCFETFRRINLSARK